MRHERGRWYGPAQVITIEKARVVWLSHGGYLIRASPQHLRPASMREYHALPRDDQGNVRDEQVSTRTRNYVDLDELPPAVGSMDDDDGYEPSLAPTPTMEIDSEQPEDEASPPESNLGGTPEEEDPENGESSGVAVNGDLGGLGIPVPGSDEEADDSLFVFGDDCEPLINSGVWEITLTES